MHFARLTVFLWLTACILPAQDNPPTLRLDGNTVPVRYHLQLELDPAHDEFSGTQDIDIVIARPVRTVWLNAHELRISQSSLETGGKTVPARTRTSGTDFLGVDFDAPVSGPARLHLKFRGKVEKRDPIGIFLRTENNDRFLYTQFEAISARRAFPCFDEPSYKTPWQLTLTVPESQEVFANTPVASAAKAAAGKKVVHFVETKPLPSYLVAFAVGPFETVDLGKAGRNNTPLRIIVPRGRRDRVAFAKQIIPPTLEALEKYFDVPYPYPALDQIEIAFAAPFAMENAGLITYGAGLLTAPPQGMSARQQRGAANVIAHEMAHQWFGDYVTTAWWNDIWLNEAFATWCAAKIMDELHPEWKSTVGEQVSTRYAMDTDTLASARSIRQPIDSTADIEQAFDSITYQKGAAVIRMFENYLGPDVFRAGVRAYITKHADKTATAPDFLAALSSASGRDIATAFSTFLDRAGLPELTVKLDCTTPQSPHLTIHQQRLVPVGSTIPPEMTWQVPVCVRYAGEDGVAHECHLVTRPQEQFELTRAHSCPAWVFANENAAGYYATRYPPELYSSISGAPLSLIERVSFVNTEWVLLQTGRTSAGTALNVAQKFSAGPEREVISGAADIVDSVDDIVTNDLRPNYARFIRDNFGPLAHKLGWRPGTSDNDDTKMLRTKIVPLVAIKGNDPQLRTEAVSLAREWLRGGVKFDQSTLGAILSAAAATNNAELFQELMKAADSLKERSERQLAANALGDFTDPALARRALQWLFEGDHAQLTYELPFRMMDEQETRLIPWQFLQANYDRLKQAIPAFMVTEPGVQLIPWASGLCSTAGKTEAERFFQRKLDGSAEARRPLAQLYESIDLCTARKAALADSLATFLKQY